MREKKANGEIEKEEKQKSFVRNEKKAHKLHSFYKMLPKQQNLFIQSVFFRIAWIQMNVTQYENDIDSIAFLTVFKPLYPCLVVYFY